MPANPSNKDLPDEAVEQLPVRAARHHRSLQGELAAIVEKAAWPSSPLSPDEVLAEIRRLALNTPAEAATIVRADRDRR